MTEYLDFEGQVEAVQWGRATYTVIRLPDAIASALKTAKARRVEGEINDHPVNLALTTAPVIEGPFLWAGKTLLDATGIEPGEQLEIRLRPADPDFVDLPDDVAQALHTGFVKPVWDGLSSGRQRSLLYPISTAKREATRLKRVSALVKKLKEDAL